MKAQEYPMAHLLPVSIKQELENASKTLEIIFTRFLISQSCYLESLGSIFIDSQSKISLLDQLMQHDVVQDFHALLSARFTELKQNLSEVLRLELSKLESIVKSRLRDLNLPEENLQKSYRDNFWSLNPPEDRFKNFERQNFSNTLSNKLRNFFLDNKGPTEEDRRKLYLELSSQLRR